MKVNTPVEILASRESGMVPHDLVIDAPEAGIAVKQDLATEPRKIAFTPKRVGSYAIYCSKKPPLAVRAIASAAWKVCWKSFLSGLRNASAPAHTPAQSARA